MKKIKLFLVAAVTLLFAVETWADTSLLTAGDGWTKITTISQSDIANNYYVFVANDADLMLGVAKSTNQSNNALFYQASVNPATDLTKVFYLEVNGSNYAMRNVKVDYLQFQTEWSGSNNDLRWRHNDQPVAISWTGLGLAYADGAWTLTSTQYNRPLGIYNNGTGTPVEGSEVGANDSDKGQKFQIYAIARRDFAALMGAGATAEAPKDLTGIIFNSDFENTAKTRDYGWTVSTKTGGNYNFNGAVEAWHYGDFDIHQTLSVPNGYYTVTVQALRSASAFLYAGTKENKAMLENPGSGSDFGTLKNNLAADANLGLTSVDVAVTTGQLTFGLADPNNANAWLVFDNFKLYYKGEIDLSGFVTSYKDALAAAKAVNQSSPMTASVLSALQTAISTYDDGKVDETSQEELGTATNALIEAKNNADASISAYASANTYFTQIVAVPDMTNIYTSAAWEANYTTPKAKYEAKTLTTEEANALTFGSRVSGGMPAIMLSTIKFNGTDAISAGKPYMNTWSTEGNNDGTNFKTPFYEYWVGDGDVLGAATITSTLTGLKENTYYSVSIWARVRQTNNQTKIANGVTMQVGSGVAVDISAGSKIGSSALYLEHYYAVGQSNADGELTVTITVAENSNISWLSFRDMNYTDVSSALAEKVTEAKGVKTELATLIPTAGLTALQTAIDDNDNDDGAFTSGDQFTTAIDNLSSAIATARSLVDPYAAYNALKASADNLVAVPNNDAEANSTLDAAITTSANVENQTTPADINNVTSTLKTAMVTYVGAAEPTNDECFDLTFMIVNPHFTEGNADNPTGWTVNYPDRTDGQWGGAKELRLSTHNFEAYHKQFTLSQTIADMKKGTYKVTLQGFARHDDANVTDKTNLFCGIVTQPIKNITDEYSTTPLTSGKPAMGDNNGEAGYTLNEQTVYQPNGMSGSYYFFQEVNPATNQPFYTSEVQTLIPSDGDLTIGFKCETWSDWVIWDNFHLYYYGSAIAVTIDEDVKSSVYEEDVDNANITLKRTFSENKDNWNTISLPFDLTDAETKAAFGNDVEVATYSETADGTNSTVAFNIAADAAITANTPVLLKTSTDETTFTFNGKTIKAGEAKVEGTNFDFVATYDASTTIAGGSYFIRSNKLYKSTGDTTIKGTRAYLKAKSAEVKAIKFSIGGQDYPTAIEGIEAAPAQNGAIYNIAGQRVSKAQKGIFIVNGKKVVK